VGDVDNDGAVEVLVDLNVNPVFANQLGELRLYRIDGGVWSYQTIIEGSAGYYTAAIGDPDADGDNEIVVSGYNFGQVVLFEHTAAGFVQTQIDVVRETGWPTAGYPSIGDALSHGSPQVYVGTHTNGNLYAYEWNSDAWVRSTIDENSGYIAYPHVADVDNDGADELVVSKFNWPWGIGIYQHDGAAWSRTVIELGDRQIVRFADVDGDGNTEILSVSGSSVFAHSYQTDGGWARSTLISDLPFATHNFDVGDAEDTGQEAIVVGEWDGGRIWLVRRVCGG
jgi:hypothetical protein